MHTILLWQRFRWLHVPSTLLVLLLQRAPALRLMVAEGPSFTLRSADILRSAFALAALGAYNTVTGATTFNATVVSPTTVTPSSVVKPSSGPFTTSSPSNSSFSFAVNVTGAPNTAKSWIVSGTLPAGVTVASGTAVTGGYVYNGLKVTLSGTPTAGYTGNLTITAYDSTGATGNSASVTCALTITAPPVFTTQPAAQTTLTVGGSTTLLSAASGTPSPTFQWFKGSPLLSGKTSASLSLTNVQTGDSGTYTVVATNSAGATTSAGASLTVNPASVAPSFTLQPTTQTVIAGLPLNLSATVGGTPAPSLQWYRGAAALAGQTAATLTIPSAQSSDSGDYTLVAVNSAAPSGVSSGIATITVAPVPAPAIQAGGGTRQISVPSLPGYSYQLQSTTNLVGGLWTPAGSAQNGSGATLNFSDTTPSTSFYRIQISPAAAP